MNRRERVNGWALEDFHADLQWEADYWHLMALNKRRVWFYGPGCTGWLPRLGDDEYGRRTLVLGTPITGHIVIALWRDHCEVCDKDLAELHQRVDG